MDIESITTILKNAIKNEGGMCSETQMLSLSAGVNDAEGADGGAEGGGLGFTFDLSSMRGVVKVTCSRVNEASRCEVDIVFFGGDNIDSIVKKEMQKEGGIFSNTHMNSQKKEDGASFLFDLQGRKGIVNMRRLI